LGCIFLLPWNGYFSYYVICLNRNSVDAIAEKTSTTAMWMKEPEKRRKVIVYRKELLRVSETFIKAQVRSYQRWRAILFGERTWPGGLALDGIESRTLMDG